MIHTHNINLLTSNTHTTLIPNWWFWVTFFLINWRIKWSLMGWQDSPSWRTKEKDNLKTLLEYHLHTFANMTVILSCFLTDGSWIMLLFAFYILDGGMTTTMHRGLLIFFGKYWRALHHPLFWFTETWPGIEQYLKAFRSKHWLTVRPTP